MFLKFFAASVACSMLLSSAVAAPRLVGGGDLQAKDEALDNYIRLVINNFFAALDTGIPALGLPILDPLNLGDITIPTLTVTGGHIDASIQSTAINGLSYLTLTALHLDVPKLAMDLRSILPYLKISGQYSIDGIMLGVFPIFGDGPFTVELFDLVMLGGGDLDIDPTGKYLQLSSLKMDANFTTMAFNFENLLGGGDLGATINEIMGQLGSSIFEQVKPKILDGLINGITKVVNDALSQLPIGEAVDVNKRIPPAV